MQIRSVRPLGRPVGRFQKEPQCSKGCLSRGGLGGGVIRSSSEAAELVMNCILGGEGLLSLSIMCLAHSCSLICFRISVWILCHVPVVPFQGIAFVADDQFPLTTPGGGLLHQLRGFQSVGGWPTLTPTRGAQNKPCELSMSDKRSVVLFHYPRGSLLPLEEVAPRLPRFVWDQEGLTELGINQPSPCS